MKHDIIWSSQQSTTIISILQMKKLRLQEFKCLAKGHPQKQVPMWHSNPDLPDSKAHVPNHCYSRGHLLASFQSNLLPPPFLFYFTYVPQEPLGFPLKLGWNNLHFQHTPSCELNAWLLPPEEDIRGPSTSPLFLAAQWPLHWACGPSLRKQLRSHTSPASMSVESTAQTRECSLSGVGMEKWLSLWTSPASATS